VIFFLGALVAQAATQRRFRASDLFLFVLLPLPHRATHTTLRQAFDVALPSYSKKAIARV